MNGLDSNIIHHLRVSFTECEWDSERVMATAFHLASKKMKLALEKAIETYT